MRKSSLFAVLAESPYQLSFSEKLMLDALRAMDPAYARHSVKLVCSLAEAHPVQGPFRRRQAPGDSPPIRKTKTQ
jgi:hypothetical protein